MARWGHMCTGPFMLIYCYSMQALLHSPNGIPCWVGVGAHLHQCSHQKPVMHLLWLAFVMVTPCLHRPICLICLWQQSNAQK